jgi:hypothetical protein
MPQRVDHMLGPGVASIQMPWSARDFRRRHALELKRGMQRPSDSASRHRPGYLCVLSAPAKDSMATNGTYGMSAPSSCRRAANR